MDRARFYGLASAVVLLGIVLMAGVPLVPYTVSFSMYDSPSYPPTKVSGHATALYALAGLGQGPYSDAMLVTQGNSTVLVHFSGPRISYWEGVFPSGTNFNPSNVVKITNGSIRQSAFGLVNFSATVTNVGTSPISNLTVIFHYPSYGMNQTVGGLTRSFPDEAACSPSLAPSQSCVASTSLPQSSKLLTDESYPMVIEAFSPGQASSAPGFASPFIYLITLNIRYPGAGLSPQWVQSFIQAVNMKRNATALTEDRTLDQFAAFRYNSLRAQYQISDFNFTADYHRFFGLNGPGVFEEILYPAGKDPATFPSYLHTNAPGHWAGLMNPQYSKYGYFFGTGPSVVIGPDCSAKEIPGPDINITKFVISHGCDYVIADQIWFIIILGS
ncbi:MAG TPA: hypothetical protein VGR56_10350 [Nitrososphaerales archaeon]|nr:hypothetical protein [Nitrososphaerales archaeon]